MNTEKLSIWVRSNIPVVSINILGPDETRVIREISDLFSGAPFELPINVWHLGRGLRRLEHNAFVPERDPKTNDPVAALQSISASDKPGVFVFVDLHKFLSPADKTLEAELKFMSDSLKTSTVPRRVILLGQNPSFSPDLHRKIHHVDAQLPEREEVNILLKLALERLNQSFQSRGLVFKNKLDSLDRLVRAAQGLSESEILDEIRVAAVTAEGVIDERAITHFSDYKTEAFRAFDVEFLERPNVDVKGVEPLRRWCNARSRLFAGDAPAQLPNPRGLVLVGPPGTGKTMVAKSVASWWGVRAVSLNIGSLMGSLVGQSEHHMRDVLRMAEAVAPVVVVIDEVEKAFSGLNGDSSGVIQRMFGQLLTWMAEKKAPCFVVATANSITELPPEFTRKGRFDEVFFLDLPGPEARKDILTAHLCRVDCKASAQTISLVATEANGYSGAELAEVADLAALNAWNEDRLEKPLTQKDLMMALREVSPLAHRNPTHIERMREWAVGTRRANSLEEVI